MRHAFTLMELMVSIVLIVLISLFLFGAIASSKLSNDTLIKHTAKEQLRSDLFELFYRDVMEALSIKILETKEQKFRVLQMQTGNSLYEIASPYVTYFVHSQTKMLTRLESAREITLPIAYEMENFVMADTLLSDVNAFSVYAGVETTAVENNSSHAAGGMGADMNDTNGSNNSGIAGSLPPDANTTQNNTISKSYLFYLKSSTLKTPFLFELYR